MDVLGQALALVGTIIALAEHAKTARDEQHQQIVDAFAAAEAALAPAAAMAHQARQDEAAKTAAAIAAAKGATQP